MVFSLNVWAFSTILCTWIWNSCLLESIKLTPAGWVIKDRDDRMYKQVADPLRRSFLVLKESASHLKPLVSPSDPSWTTQQVPGSGLPCFRQMYLEFVLETNSQPGPPFILSILCFFPSASVLAVWTCSWLCSASLRCSSLCGLHSGSHHHHTPGSEWNCWVQMLKIQSFNN